MKKKGRSKSLHGYRRRKAILYRTLRYAKARYRKYPNVVGITSGHKYQNGRATDDDFTVRFLVRKKLTLPILKRRLPAFLYGRSASGAVDRRVRFSTDVVALGKVRATCGAGSFLRCVPGGRGTATLVFEDKSIPSAGFFVVSCSHVLSRLSGGGKTIRSECCDAPTFASLAFASRPKEDRLEFDVGIAQLSPECIPQPDVEVVPDLSIPRSRLVGIAPAELITPKLPVFCRMRVSHNVRGVVADHPNGGEVDIEYPDDGLTLTVENICLLEVSQAVVGGDSGGLIFTQDNRALGIVIASSDTGWAIFHPFSKAFQYITEKTKHAYKPF